jgi:hypothetical protein
MEEKMNAVADVDVKAMAERMCRDIERGDWAAVGKINASDMRVWHNFDQAEMTWDQATPFLSMLRENAELHYEDIRITPVPNGWLQQHVLRLVLKAGGECRMPAALIVMLNDQGLVSRIEEYLDSAQLSAALPGSPG